MDDQEHPVARLHRQRGVDRRQRAHRRRGVQQLVPVGHVVGRDPPGPGVVGQVELGELLRDGEGAQGGLLGKLVTEAEAVIEDPKDHVEPAAQLLHLGGRHPQLVVVVAHPGHLAPGLLPRLVDRPPLGPRQLQAVAQGRSVAELEAQPRGQNDLPAVALYAVEEAALRCPDRYDVTTVGRGHLDGLLGIRADGGRQQGRHGDRDRPQTPGHPSDTHTRNAPPGTRTS